MSLIEEAVARLEASRAPERAAAATKRENEQTLKQNADAMWAPVVELLRPIVGASFLQQRTSGHRDVAIFPGLNQTGFHSLRLPDDHPSSSAIRHGYFFVADDYWPYPANEVAYIVARTADDGFVLEVGTNLQYTDSSGSDRSLFRDPESTRVSEQFTDPAAAASRFMDLALAHAVEDKDGRVHVSKGFDPTPAPTAPPARHRWSLHHSGDGATVHR